MHASEPNARRYAEDESGRGGANATPAEITEVERRMLAHEHILQALVAHLAGDDPEILTRLKARFGSDHDLGHYEQNYVSTEDYGAHFIWSVEQEVDRHNRPHP